MPPNPLSPLTSPPTAPNALGKPATSAATNATGRGGGASVARGGEGHHSALNPGTGNLDQTFSYSESALADALRLPLGNVTNARVKKLARGTDWELLDNVVALTEKAVAVLAATLTTKPTPAELQLLLQKSRRTALPVQFQARVARRQPANTKLLAVEWTEDDQPRTANIVTIRRDFFRAGMEVPIRLNSELQRYELARTAPRAKGRW